MTAQGLESLEHSVHLTRAWIKDLDQRLRWDDKPRSYRLLIAVLHALRDSLQIKDAIDLGTPLPGLLRGAYYEQWHPTEQPVKASTVDALIARVNESFLKDPLADPPMAVMAVFQHLATKIAEGANENIKRCLPKELRGIWTDYAKSTSGPH